MTDVVTGACLCGQVEFELRDPQTMGVCHCTRCRRWTGGAAPLVVVTPDNFEVTKGQDVLRQYGEEGFARRYFCSNCGSPVYSGGGGVNYVAAGVLHDLKLMPAWHVQVANKEPWDEIGGDATQFAEYPPH
jgi:hypothetical protein